MDGTTSLESINSAVLFLSFISEIILHTSLNESMKEVDVAGFSEVISQRSSLGEGVGNRRGSIAYYAA